MVSFAATQTFMKRFYCSLVILLGFVSLLQAQSYEQVQVLHDTDGSKILMGILNRASITSDTSFSWYAPSAKDYTPYKKAVESIGKHRDSLQFIVFLGTWCHDTQFIIPKFFRLMDAAYVVENKIALFGVDRDKKTLGPLADALQIIDVPTIIVMKNGHELGRVVEYGRYGMFDKELGEIVDAAFASGKN